MPEPILRGAVEFLLSQDRLTASYLIAKDSDLDIRQAIDLSIEVEKVLMSIVEVGYRKLDEQEAKPERDDA